MKFVKFCLIFLLCNSFIVDVGQEKEKISIKQVREKDTMSYFVYENRRIPIMSGTSKEILDLNVVGIMDTFDHFNEKKTTILAAHNDTVFDFLEEIELGSLIQIEGSILKSYRVFEKNIISENDMSYFRQGMEEKLILLTCYGYKKRLVVLANPL